LRYTAFVFFTIVFLPKRCAVQVEPTDDRMLPVYVHVCAQSTPSSPEVVSRSTKTTSGDSPLENLCKYLNSLKLIDPHDSLLVCFEHMLSSIPPIHDICQCLHHHQHSIFPTMLWLVQFCSPMYRPQHCTHQC
jgi:hypothetical protein